MSTDIPAGEEYVETTLYATKDGRWANQGGDSTWYLVDHAGNRLLDQPIGEDEVIG